MLPFLPSRRSCCYFNVFSHLSFYSFPAKAKDNDRNEAEDSDSSSSSLPSLEDDEEAEGTKPKQEEEKKKKSAPKKKSTEMSESKDKRGKVNNDVADFTAICVSLFLYRQLKQNVKQSGVLKYVFRDLLLPEA